MIANSSNSRQKHSTAYASGGHWTTSVVVMLCFSIFLFRFDIPLVKADGVQSGPSEGPLYSGGMIFDATNELLYISGLHYNNVLGADLQVLEGREQTSQSNCFLGMIDMSLDIGEFDAFDDWNTFGSSSILETCHAITKSGDSLLLVGSAEPGSDLLKFQDDTIPLSGMILVVSSVSLDLSEGLTLQVPSNPTEKLLTPVAAVSDGNNSFYVAALTSTDAILNQQVKDTDSFPNWQDQPKYGTSQDMTIFKITVTQSTAAEIDGMQTGVTDIKDIWTQEFPVNQIDGEDIPPQVYIGGLIYKIDVNTQQEYLVIAGSTRGLGPGYGEGIGNDEDGFLTVLDPSTGQLHTGIRNNIREGTAEDDVVAGICDDAQDPQYFFVVGATRGGNLGTQQTDSTLLGQVSSGSLQPFLRKVNVSELAKVWTNQWAPLPAASGESSVAYAQGCTVDGNTVYVTGTVKDGASMVQGSTRQPSQGGDDVFVVAVDKMSGQVQWMTQLGSKENEKVAPHGAIVTNSQGNVIILGDTYGSLYRERESSETIADTFVMSLDAVTGKLLDDDFLGGTSSGDKAVEESEGNKQEDDEKEQDQEVGEDAPVSQEPAPISSPVSPGVSPVPPQTVGHQYTPIGLQIPGPAYAGGLVYDNTDNCVLLAGATYVLDEDTPTESSYCFTGKVNLDNGNLDAKFAQGSATLPEACSAVSFDPLRSAAYFIGGMRAGPQNVEFQPSALWTETDGTIEAGMILQVNMELQLIGGNRVVGYPVVYPAAIVGDPIEAVVYVASMVSNEDASSNEDKDIQYPDYTTGGIRPFGSRFFLSVESYSVDILDSVPEIPIPANLLTSWSASYATDDDSLTVSGMTLAGNGNNLIVVGSTKGSGGPFEDNDGDDMDGWILKLDPATGQLSPSTNDTERSSTRLDSINKKDDMILQVCNDRFDHDAFYVVGTSAGKVRSLPDDKQPPEGSFHAFVAKINTKELSAEWLKHYTMTAPGGGPMTGEALSCTVTYDSDGNNIVYVGGTVKNGALLDGVSNLSQSYGGDDIFVAAMDGATGGLRWIQQIGTAEDDRLASGQGLDVDSFGNVVVFGVTTGKMYGENQGRTDMIVFTMNKFDGSYLSARTEGEGIGINAPEDVPSGSSSSSYIFPDVAVALQSGPDVGPSYAGGMVYDPFTNALYLTGATYGTFSSPSPGLKPSPSSKCFLGVVSMPNMQWKERSVFGTDSVPEACSALALADYLGKSEVMMVGSMEAGGLLSGLSTGGSNVHQYGMILDVSNQGGTYQLLGGAVADETEVQFPIQVITNEHQVFMVSMSSRDATVHPDNSKSNTRNPNYTTGGIEKYGAEYGIVVERYTINRGADGGSGVLGSTMKLDWRKPFESADQQSVYVAGMAMVDSGDAMVVVGSTQSAAGDFDGIMAKVNVEDGSFEAESSNSRSVAYFSSSSGQDDWIHGICTDPKDPNAFYVVGATGGTSNGSGTQDDNILAMVAKVKVDRLEIEWNTLIEAIPAPGAEYSTALALGCDVVRDKGHIYITGNVEKGAAILNKDDPQQSFGADDIFVAMLETRNGKIMWVKQVGSMGDDRVAHGGGVVADKNGNAIVYGDTTGTLYRRRTDDLDASFSDVFLVVFNQADGVHLPPYAIGWDDSTSFFFDPKYFVFAITVSIMLAVVLLCFCYARQVQLQRAEAQKSSIFAYLQAFDVEDIDLRKSPPGGWHGTYLNKLAYGINKADTGGQLSEALDTAPNSSNNSNASNDGMEMAPLTSLKTHSSIVKDSLFMDTMSSPSLGNQDDYYDDLTPRSSEERKNNSFRGTNIGVIEEPSPVKEII